MKALITFLATWLVAAQLHADGFSLADANTSTIDRSKWQCKSCSLEGSAVSGDARLGIGAVDSDNDQIVNKFGSDDGGFAVLGLPGPRPSDLGKDLVTSMLKC